MKAQTHPRRRERQGSVSGASSAARSPRRESSTASPARWAAARYALLAEPLGQRPAPIAVLGLDGQPAAARRKVPQSLPGGGGLGACLAGHHAADVLRELLLGGLQGALAGADRRPPDDPPLRRGGLHGRRGGLGGDGDAERVEGVIDGVRRNVEARQQLLQASARERSLLAPLQLGEQGGAHPEEVRRLGLAQAVREPEETQNSPQRRRSRFRHVSSAKILSQSICVCGESET